MLLLLAAAAHAQEAAPVVTGDPLLDFAIRLFGGGAAGVGGAVLALVLVWAWLRRQGLLPLAPATAPVSPRGDSPAASATPAADAVRAEALVRLEARHEELRETTVGDGGHGERLAAIEARLGAVEKSASDAAHAARDALAVLLDIRARRR